MQAPPLPKVARYSGIGTLSILTVSLVVDSVTVSGTVAPIFRPVCSPVVKEVSRASVRSVRMMLPLASVLHLTQPTGEAQAFAAPWLCLAAQYMMRTAMPAGIVTGVCRWLMSASK